MAQRRTDLDALRSFAMLLGIALHASLSFFAFPWPVHDIQRSDLLPLFLVAVHGFRMPLFFLISGYFTMLVYRRRGLRSLLEQRFQRIVLPLVIAAAPLIGLNTLGVDDVLRGRERLRGLLPTGPNAESTLGGPLDRLMLAWSRILSSEHLRVRVGSSSIHLVQTNLFDHLWFLWFLCWLVAIFALLAATGLLPSGRWRWWLMAASCLPQAVMGMSLAGGYGPDTSLGLLPKPHVFGFYACFFFFGVATFAADGLDTRLGRRWKLLLPAAAVLLVAGIVTMNDRLLATLLQPAYAWTMSLGLIGLFCRLFPHPHAAVSWLADASYWMYLVHVPLVIAAQLLVRQWPLPAGVKFFVILGLVTPLLLASYRWCVRYTVIGSLLNGPREFHPASGALQ